MSFLWFILIGILAGYIAGLIMKGKGFGLVVNLIIGIVGGVLGGWLFDLIGLGTYGKIAELVCATVGAIFLLFVVSLIKKK